MRIRVREGKLVPLAAATLAMTLLSVLGGCSGGGKSQIPASNGPLSSAVDGHLGRGFNCVRGGERQTFGDQTFTNHGRISVILDRVVLRHASNERIIGSYAMPGQRLIGIVPWPPKYRHMPPAWKNRQPVSGFRVPPGRSFNMVLGTEAIVAGRATAKGMLVYYHDSQGTYVAENLFGMIIAASKLGCHS